MTAGNTPSKCRAVGAALGNTLKVHLGPFPVGWGVYS